MDFLKLLELFFVASLGLIFGSFATALVHRVPAGLSWGCPDPRLFLKNGLFSKKVFSSDAGSNIVAPTMVRSECPTCHHKLSAPDLIPVFSWLLLRGRCRFCRARIGYVYPLTELVTATGCVLLYCSRGLDAMSIVAMATVPFLVAMAVIDLRHMILPNTLNAALAVVWAASVAVLIFYRQPEGEIWTYAWTGIVSSFVYGVLAWGMGLTVKKILGKEALGFGDVKFFAVAGLWLGIHVLPVFLILSGVLGVVIGLVYRILFRESYFPFGPALIGSFFILLLFLRPDFIL